LDAVITAFVKVDYCQYRITSSVPDMTTAVRATNNQSGFDGSFIA
jgi:hypothetical protein